MKMLLTLMLCLCAAPAFAATCKVSEYANLVLDENGRQVPVPEEPSLASQNITYTTTTASSAFNARTRFVRIVCDAKAHFVFGSAPTSTAAAPYLATDTAEYFGVPRGQSYKVSFYDGSS